MGTVGIVEALPVDEAACDVGIVEVGGSPEFLQGGALDLT